MKYLLGSGRGHGFYSIATLVIASGHELFSVMNGSVPALAIGAPVLAVLAAVYLAGFKASPKLVAGALAAHGPFDLKSDPGEPVWWPILCLAYDIAAAIYLAWRRDNSALATPAPVELKPQSAGEIP